MNSILIGPVTVACDSGGFCSSGENLRALFFGPYNLANTYVFEKKLRSAHCNVIVTPVILIHQLQAILWMSFLFLSPP
jgi:hypothetical protein